MGSLVDADELLNLDGLAQPVADGVPRLEKPFRYDMA